MSQDWEQQQSGVALADWVGVARIGRKRYAISLIWNSAEKSMTLRDDAREAAALAGSDVFALKPGRGEAPAQYALGDQFLGHRAGLPALAAALAEKLDESLFAVWRIGEGVWWLVGIRADGTIVYDKGLSQESTAQSEFFEGAHSEPWTHTICPESWQVDGSEPDEDLRARLGRAKVQLRALEARVLQKLIKLVLAIALVGGLGYGGLKWLEPPPPPPPPVQMAPPPAMPWVGQPLPAQVLDACVAGLLAHAVAAFEVPGWMPLAAGGRCDGARVVYGIKREFGTDAWLDEMGPRVSGRPEVAPASNGESSLSWPLPPLVRYAEGAPGSPLAETRKNLQAQFDELFLPIVFTAGQPEPYWQSLGFAIAGPLSPEVLIPLIGVVPGLVIEWVGYSPISQVWGVQGRIYERLEPPPQPANP